MRGERNVLIRGVSRLFVNKRNLYIIAPIAVVMLSFAVFLFLAKPFNKTSKTSGTEVIAQRTEKSTTFKNDDGTYTKRVYTSPVNYKDSNGKWKKINTSLDKKGSMIEVVKAPYQVHFSQDSKEKVSFKAGNEKIDFVLSGINSTTAKVKGSKAVYKEVYKNTDLERIATTNGLKQNYILKASGHPKSFKERINTSLTTNLQKDGAVGFYEGKKLTAVLPKPFLIDAKGVQKDLEYVITGAGAEKTLSLNLPPLEGLEYPITVDPTITIPAGSGGGFPRPEDTYVLSSSATRNYSTWQTLQVGWYLSGENISFIKFDLSSIPGGSIISQADLKLNLSAKSSANLTVQVNSIDTSWNSSTVSWSNKPSTGNWAGPTMWGSNTYWSWDITSLVSSWVDNSRVNNGMSLERVETSTSVMWVRYISSEGSGGYKPYIEVTYTEPPPDSVPPSSSIADPTVGQYIGGTSYLISGTSSDADSGVQKVDVSTNGGSTWANATLGVGGDWSYNWTLPSDGVYIIKSRATDNANNVETPGSGVTVTVDKTPPTASITVPTGGNVAGIFDLEGVADDTNFDYYKIEYGAGAAPASWTQVGGNYTTAVSPAGLLANINPKALAGTYTYRLTAYDKAGNSSTANVTINLTQPTQALNPHANYTQEPDLCALCHRTHTATLGKLVSGGPGINYQADFCFTCHDGTGSRFNVRGAVDKEPDGANPDRSHHPVNDQFWAANNDSGTHTDLNHTMNCSDCHNPHGDLIDPNDSGQGYYPKLLRAKDTSGTPYYQGNEFCGACHGPGSTLVRGDHLTVFSTIPHNTMFADPPATSVVNPGASTGIKCLICHANSDTPDAEMADGLTYITEGTALHSSGEKSITKRKEEQLCFGAANGVCHSIDYPIPGVVNIKDRFTNPLTNSAQTTILSARHNIADAEQVDADDLPGTPIDKPSKVECNNCHNPHKNDRDNKMADPDNVADLLTDTRKDPKLWNDSQAKGIAVFQPAAFRKAANGTLSTEPQTDSNGKDAKISSGLAGSNFGSSELLGIGYKTTEGKIRSLIQFVDLSKIPTGATITSATLSWPWTTTGPGTETNQNISVHRITFPWLEDTVTWNNQPAHDATATASGLGTIDSSANELKRIKWDITSLVTAWYNGTQPNYGLKVIAPIAEAQTANMYLSLGYLSDDVGASEKIHLAGDGDLAQYPGVTNRPTLRVEYTGGTATTVKDSITFCLKCHDGTPPSGVVVPNLDIAAVNQTRQNILNVANNYLRTDGKADMHGAQAGTLFKDTSVFNPGNSTINYEGEFRGPYYAGMDPILCGDCHDPHGSTNQYHLKENINWLTDITTSYGIIDPSDRILSNVCGSCHRFWHDVPGSYGCVYCHFHGAKADTEPTTNF